jgi:hypothetical protein
MIYCIINWGGGEIPSDVFDGVGEVEGLNPLEDFTGEA